MCGIISYLGPDVYRNILSGLEQVQNRGYDSAGILTFIPQTETSSLFFSFNSEEVKDEGNEQAKDEGNEQAKDEGNEQVKDEGNEQVKEQVKEPEWTLHKYASTDKISAIEKLKTIPCDMLNIGIGIGHTRWATHGEKSDINAHPHLDAKNEFGLVHNGIIENYDKIKIFLESKGYKLNSQTDTEVIVYLISFFYEKTKNIQEAIQSTISELEGTYALCIITKHSPNTIYCIRKGSPLLVGLSQSNGSSHAFIVSELSGFCNKVDKYIILENNDLCILQFKNNKIKIQYSNHYPYLDVKKEFHSITPHPYDHWTLKEIMEQPVSILKCLCYGSRISRQLGNDISPITNQYSQKFSQRTIKLGGLDKITDDLMDVKHLIILGCGTSYFSGASTLPWFKKYTNFDSVNVYDPSEFYEYHIPKSGKVCCIFISQSGETKDLYDKIELMKRKNIIRIGVINVVDSYIAREMNAGVYLHIGREVGVASTKAFTSQVLCLTLIMLWFMENENPYNHIIDEFIESIVSLPNDINILLEKNYNLCKDVSNLLKNKEHLFILAKEPNIFYAHEGSLKLKEIGYIHSEAYSSSSLKHGPYALIEKNTPVILLCPKDENFSKHQSIKEEILSRGGKIIGISNVDLDSKYSRQIVVPNNKHFFGILSSIMLQVIAYELSVNKGINPDQPRNLAKVVTVD